MSPRSRGRPPDRRRRQQAGRAGARRSRPHLFAVPASEVTPGYAEEWRDCWCDEPEPGDRRSWAVPPAHGIYQELDLQLLGPGPPGPLSSEGRAGAVRSTPQFMPSAGSGCLVGSADPDRLGTDRARRRGRLPDPRGERAARPDCSQRPDTRSRRLFPVTAARDDDGLHLLVDRLNPRHSDRLRALFSPDPELAPAAGPEGQGAARRHMSLTGIWESGRGDLAERHDEIIRGRLKRPA